MGLSLGRICRSLTGPGPFPLHSRKPIMAGRAGKSAKVRTGKSYPNRKPVSAERACFQGRKKHALLSGRNGRDDEISCFQY